MMADIASEQWATSGWNRWPTSSEYTRYLCGTMKSVYDAPLCQSLTAAPLDALMAQLVLEAVKPAALEVSLAVATDLEAERAALERHWQQRRERAGCEVERARRQYNAVEPENRLVARTLERAWEEALAEQVRLEADYQRHQRERPAMPSPEELSAVRALAQDLPALWWAETTTQEERQTIVRLLVEHILVEIIDGSEQVRIAVTGKGAPDGTPGDPSGLNAKSLSTYDALVARTSELRRAGHDCVEIADILNRESWRPAKRCDAFSASMVRHLLYAADPEAAARRLRCPKINREPDERTIPNCP